MYYKNAAAVALVFDSTNEDSFISIESWAKEIEQNASNSL
jgi:GTPase SAR1 family protein